MSFTDEYLFIQFDQTTLENDRIRQDLLRFYCNIWKYDPNFGEYKKCPVCHKYYNQEQVESGRVSSCRGTPPNFHSPSNLVEAWTEDIVWKELQSLVQKGPDFFGAVAVVPQTGRIIGFVWGYLADFTSVSAKWSPTVLAKILCEMPSEKITYFQEIAVDRSFQKIGAGTVLCRMLTKWMKENHPDLPSFLHTHLKSPAYRLFQKAGYHPYEIISGPNEGRVLMACPKGKLLTPNNLINY